MFHDRSLQKSTEIPNSNWLLSSQRSWQSELNEAWKRFGNLLLIKFQGQRRRKSELSEFNCVNFNVQWKLIEKFQVRGLCRCTQIKKISRVSVRALEENVLFTVCHKSFQSHLNRCFDALQALLLMLFHSWFHSSNHSRPHLQLLAVDTLNVFFDLTNKYRSSLQAQ